MARQHLLRLGLDAESWGLPYWNYSDYLRDAQALTLPLPLRSALLPDEVDVPGVAASANGQRINPLHEAARVMMDLPRELDAPPGDLWADASDALNRLHYGTRNGRGMVSFAGGYLEDPALFHAAEEGGLVDAQPHGSVHMQVGLGMTDFRTAGMDPVFWMHHANVDRLWETYAHDLGHGYPFDSPDDGPSDVREAWEVDEFAFLRPRGDPVTWTAKKLTDVVALGYEYDTTAPPQFVPLARIPQGAEIDPFGFAPDDAAPQPIAVARDVSIASTIEIALSSGDGLDDDFGIAEDVLSQGRWVLRFDGIRTAEPAVTSYQVFLGLEPGEDPDPDDRSHYVGLLSLFGVFEASQDDGTSSTAGRVRMFDVTAQVEALGAGIDPLHPVVRLVPLNPSRDVAAMELTVERVALETV